MKRSELKTIIVEELNKVLLERGVRPMPRQIRNIVRGRSQRSGPTGNQLPMSGYYNPQTKRVEPQISMAPRSGEVLPFRRPETKKETEPQKAKKDITTTTFAGDPLEETAPCVGEFKKLWMLYKESLGREDFITDIQTWSQNNRDTPCEIDLFLAGLCVYGANDNSHNYQIENFSIPIMVEYKEDAGSVGAFGFGDCGAFNDSMYYEASELIYWENKKQQAILRKIEEIKKECEFVVGKEALEQWESWFGGSTVENVAQCLILSEMSEEKVIKIISFAVDMPTAREVVKECPQFVEWLNNKFGTYNCTDQLSSIEDRTRRRQVEKGAEKADSRMEDMLKTFYGEHPDGGSWVEELDAGRLKRSDGSWILRGDPDWSF